MPVTKEQVIEMLKLVSDPEVMDREGKPVDIWEMGLVYNIDITAEEPAAVNIRMTLTSQGCPMGQMIQRDVLARVGSIPGVSKTNVEVVWQPQWTPALMSTDAKQRLGMEEMESH
jgi:metal-sulfur cluster biosynthetic enzyme